MSASPDTKRVRIHCLQLQGRLSTAWMPCSSRSSNERAPWCCPAAVGGSSSQPAGSRGRGLNSSVNDTSHITLTCPGCSSVDVRAKAAASFRRHVCQQCSRRLTRQHESRGAEVMSGSRDVLRAGTGSVASGGALASSHRPPRGRRSSRVGGRAASGPSALKR